MCYSQKHANAIPVSPKHSTAVTVTLNDKSKLGLSTFIAFYGVLTFYNITLAHSLCNTDAIVRRNSMGFESNLFRFSNDFHEKYGMT